IKAIRDLGAIQQGEQEIDPIKVYTERPSDKIAQVLILDLSNIDNIYPIQYEKEMSYKFLLKAPKGNEKLKVPAITIFKIVDVKEKIDDFINYFKNIKVEDNNDLFLMTIKNLESEFSNIKEKLVIKANEVFQSINSQKENKNKAIIISIIYDEHFPYEISYLKNKFLLDYSPDKKKNINSTQNDRNSCSICSSKSSKLINGAKAYKFYNNDKLGYITGGFDITSALKNYPICTNCDMFVTQGKKYLEEKFRFRIGGLEYILVPKLLTSDKELFKEILNIIEDFTKKITLNNNSKNDYIENEQLILELLKEQENYLSYSFLFLKANGNDLRINYLIDDVLPSRLRKIFEVKKIVENAFSSNEYKTIFTFIKIRQFFSKSDDGKKGNDLDEYFLTIIDSVFKEKNLELDFLLKFFMKKIRNAIYEKKSDNNKTKSKKKTENYKNKPSYNQKYYLIKDAIMNFMFFYNLHILPINEGVKMEDPIFNDFFEKYSMQLNTPEKRGLLLLGALVENLLYIQRTDRGAEPFWHHLKSLKMNEIEFKGLIPKATEKLHQYDKLKTWDKKLISTINDYFLKSTVKWNMSIDEMNFYFSCGMSMQYEIYSKFNNSNNKENQNGKN
ncbi:MAG: TIGR02556 family CRISPR-associated protein, partial [Candidatus Nanoarchaeia archaeon]|nr:TIGR02556 family CRISPR-associated protein [Candidatus Nanoarchaeia archaeon]